MSTKDEPLSSSEEIILKIKDGYLIILPESECYNFSYVLLEKKKCFKFLTNPGEVKSDSLGKIDYDVRYENEKTFLMIGPIKKEMKEETKDASFFDNFKSKIETISNINYAKLTEIKHGQIYGGDPRESGNKINFELYSVTRPGQYLEFTFKKPFTINFICFTLYNADKRVFVYTVEVEAHGKWIPITVNKLGQGYEELNFKPIIGATGVRFSGYSTSNAIFIILNNYIFSINYILNK